jgi:hypothetical protein
MSLYLTVVANPLLLASLPDVDNLSFLANMIRSGACNGREDVYCNLRKGEDVEGLNKGVWAQYRCNYTEWGGKKYIDREHGGAIGINFDIGDYSLIGLYIKGNKHNMSQLNNSGNLVKGMVGVCGAFLYDRFELKWIVGYSFGRHNMCLEGRNSNKVRGKFGVQGVGLDIEGALKIVASDTLKIRPYIRLEGDMEDHEKMKEGKLSIEGGDCSRLLATAGVRVSFNVGKSEFSGGVGYKCLLSKETFAVKLALKEGVSKYINSVKEGRHKGVVGIGWNYDISKCVGLHAGVNYVGGKNYKNVGGTAGINIRF